MERTRCCEASDSVGCSAVHQSILDTVQHRHIPKQCGSGRVSALPPRSFLPFRRHDIPVVLPSRPVSGPPQPGILQALHCRQLLLNLRPPRPQRRVSSRLLLNGRRVLSILHSVFCRPDAACVRTVQLRSMSRGQLLLNRRPPRSNRQLLSWILLLRRRRFCIMHSLSQRQLLPLPCNVSSDSVSRRQLLPLGQPQSCHPLHPRHVLCRHRPRSCVGKLRSRLLQQRRRCNVGLHDVRGRTVPGHGGTGLVQALPSRRLLFEHLVTDPRRLARASSALVQVLIYSLQSSTVCRVGVAGANRADVCAKPRLRSS